MWLLVLIIFGVGAVGGFINALISDNGFALPKHTAGILRPVKLAEVNGFSFALGRR